MRDKGRRNSICHWGNPIPGTRRDKVEETRGIPFPNIQPSQTKLRHLQPRIPGYHSRPRKLEAPTCWKPPPSNRPYGSQQPPVLAPPTTNQQMHRPLPSTTSRLQRPIKAPTWSNEQGRSPLPKARL